MGFGHRVYKNFDPRATIIREHCHKVLKHLGKENDPLLELALKLEEIALSDDYFKSRSLYPNVDFYTGIIYKAPGIPVNTFTPMFAIARTVGWAAHWIEMASDPTLPTDRQGAGEGKSVFVGVDLGGIRSPTKTQSLIASRLNLYTTH